MTIKINSLLEVEKKRNGLKVHLKITHDSDWIEFYMCKKEVYKMWMVLHKEDILKKKR